MVSYSVRLAIHELSQRGDSVIHPWGASFPIDHTEGMLEGCRCWGWKERKRQAGVVVIDDDPSRHFGSGSCLDIFRTP